MCIGSLVCYIGDRDGMFQYFRPERMILDSMQKLTPTVNFSGLEGYVRVKITGAVCSIRLTRKNMTFEIGSPDDA